MAGQGRPRRGTVSVRRIYEPADQSGGTRVLVDRLWPRGISKDAAGIDEWCREVAPSTELRKWYGHDPDRFAEFRRRYRAELKEPDRAQLVRHLRELAGSGPLTLVTATKDVAISAATVLRDVLS